MPKINKTLSMSISQGGRDAGAGDGRLRDEEVGEAAGLAQPRQERAVHRRGVVAHRVLTL